VEGAGKETRKIHLNTKFGWVNMEKRDGFEKLRADGKIILKLALRKKDEIWTRFVCFRIEEPVVGRCKRGNDPWSVINYSEFLD